jgi:hypothetical protein
MSLPVDFRRFAGSREGVEAVIQRLGAAAYDVILVDAAGNWTRAVVESEEAALRACEDLGVTAHMGWEGHALGQRMNDLDAWSTPGATRRAL